jgi:hypothetical protein
MNKQMITVVRNLFLVQLIKSTVSKKEERKKQEKKEKAVCAKTRDATAPTVRVQSLVDPNTAVYLYVRNS